MNHYDKSTQQPAGYTWLVETYRLETRPHWCQSFIKRNIKSRETAQYTSHIQQNFRKDYAPQNTILGHLEFALRYEGINLEILSRLFTQDGKAQLEAALQNSPKSRILRRLGFLYEGLIGVQLSVPDIDKKSTYIKLADDKFYVTHSQSTRSERFRIENNLISTFKFCPVVRRTPTIQAFLEQDLAGAINRALVRYNPHRLERAAAWLYLKETQYSFDIEREKPSGNKTERFMQALREASDPQPVTQERLCLLQNIVVDARFREVGYRNHQNYVGRELNNELHRVDFLPPRPEDIHSLMQDWIDWSNHLAEEDRVSAPIAAALAAFAFVFLHPFMDGNGRIHRFLVHEVLTRRGFTPRGFILPVSAVMKARLDEYIHALEAFSKPLKRLTEYYPITPNIPAQGNDALLYRYFDATPQVEFLLLCLKQVIEKDLAQELQFLLNRDALYEQLNEEFDWPGTALDKFIIFVHQNGGKLSKVKRDKYFSYLTDAEISSFEITYKEVFKTAHANA
ncbi:Filamentation induced by cAMP protein Fic [Mycoavidus cysteinexigens]|uniref:Filamentation induced by cAMP protein Fic n=1 Tax=Mycoavidus cysteinexigens TaxID=1553431 RepID=A0A2Z6ESN5_9BURK|nr:Fic family protein [Mycoavidus cysteinexigens]BBE08427.1 Filamentation induced by cAMP protein Fic [Mycoavidus cysteinexigens]GAM52865.1 filamentation induced by cAMP protein Fic [bacterium endosymbiont of Mortierella elongata FMR23-6]GLR00933.1 cell division protein Fic [Mycoavidus cysteinexigens]